MVSTSDSESDNPSSNLGRTYVFFLHLQPFCIMFFCKSQIHNITHASDRTSHQSLHEIMYKECHKVKICCSENQATCYNNSQHIQDANFWGCCRTLPLLSTQWLQSNNSQTRDKHTRYNIPKLYQKKMPSPQFSVVLMVLNWPAEVSWVHHK